MKKFDDIKEIISHFNISDDIVSWKENNTGIINNTFVVEGTKGKYILQKINTDVFKDPEVLMNNINNVTKYYKEHSDRKETLNVIGTKDGLLFYTDKDGCCYRVYNYIDNAITYNYANSKEQFGKVGKAFGSFCRILNDYPSNNLEETIPNFHNTLVRYNKLLDDIKKDDVGRVKDVLKEIKFVQEHENEVSIILDLIKEGKIPVRVTHNDTKINNVLFDKDTDDDICVIDLDTVMPGSLLYDFGDAIRSGSALVVEDSTDYSAVGMNLDFFEEFTKCFLQETGSILTYDEVNYLAFSCKLLTLELIIRFLDDYICGDTYFRCDYAEHNLVRTRNQINLLMDMEEKYDEMVNIVKKYSKYTDNYCLKKVN